MTSKAIYISIVAAVFIISCGVKAPPKPPLDKAPQAVGRVAAKPKENGIILTWKAPDAPSTESKYTTAESFIVERGSRKSDGEEWSEYDPAGSVGMPEKGKTVEWKDTAVKPGRAYRYRIAALDAAGVSSSYSKVVSTRWEQPPGAPIDVAVEVGDSFVSLRWKPSQEGITIEGYYIYRAEGQKKFVSLSGDMIIPAEEYLDIGLTNGVTYKYYISAAGIAGTYLIEGPASSIVEAIPVDKIAPRVPVGAAAFAVPEGIRVTWWPNLEEDLAGYFIFRTYGGKTEKLNAQPIKENSFIDAGTKRAGTYSYKVSAIDKDGNESPKSEPGSLFIK